MTTGAMRLRFAVQAAALCALLPASTGCNRTFYREAADLEVRVLVDEKSNDPRWDLSDFTIEVDPRSRYAELNDRDFPPMPPDDPASHAMMHCIDGKDGYTGWHDYGETNELENPWWREYLGQYAQVTPDGKLRLTLEDSVRIARLQSPDYQEQLETIYLSALDVSTERFRFDTQFFGGTGLAYTHVGEQRAGGESNRVTLDTRATVTRRLSAAGELLVGFANNTVWEFTGPNQGFTTSLVNFSLIQPLLRGGGRAVALERLTISERTLLANLRSMERYRQGFYGTVVFGESDVGGPQRRGGFFGAGLEGFTGQGSGGFAGVGTAAGFGRGFGGAGGGGGGGGFAGGGVSSVGGYVGLLQSMQSIRNAEASLALQLRTLALLESNLDAGLVNLAQVDQFRQSIETQRAQLLQFRNSLQSQLDNFKRGTLGLPPDLPIDLDDSYIRQFQLIDNETSRVQTELDALVTSFGAIAEEPSLVELQQYLQRIAIAREDVRLRLDATPAELEAMDAAAPVRFETMRPEEQAVFRAERARLSDNYQVLIERFAATEDTLDELDQLLAPETRTQVAEAIIVLLTELQAIVNDVSLVQARARIERISVEPIELSPETALEIARANRLDWMNNRAALVDVWRLIEFNANRLKSDVTVGLAGDVQTVRNNPLSFDGNATSFRASLQIDPPFTRLVERNVFRQQLIEYQQSRRRLIQYEDGVHQGLRALLRDLEQLTVNLEIQRRATAIAIRRVDQTRESLNEPIPPAQPGQPPTALGPTVAQDLLFALRDLATAQDALMSVWIGYQAATMRLYRELGIMQVDNDNLWIETPLFSAQPPRSDEEGLPPDVPQSWFDALDKADQEGQPETAPVLLPPAEREGAAKMPARDPSKSGSARLNLDSRPPVARPSASRESEAAVRRAGLEQEPAAARISISSGNDDNDDDRSQASPLERLGQSLRRR